MKAYGVADGVLIALCAAMAATILSLAFEVSAIYFVGLAIAAAGLLAAGARFGGKIGHSLVDGAFLQPWLRQALLLAAVCSMIAIPLWFGQPSTDQLDVVPPVETDAAETVKLDNDRCSELKTDVAAFQKGLPTAEGKGLTRQWGMLAERNRNGACGLEAELKTAADQIITRSEESAVTDEQKVKVADLKEKLAPPAQAAQTSPDENPPKKATEAPAWADEPPELPDVFAPEPAKDAEPTPPTEEGDDAFIEKVIQLVVASLPFGSTTITTDEIIGAIRSAANGEGDRLAALEEKIAGKYQNEALRTAVRRYANSQPDPEKRKRLNEALNKKPETELCHFVLSRLPNAPDQEVLMQIVPAGNVEATIQKISQSDWRPIILKVRTCVHAQDRPNYQRYESVFQDLDTWRRRLRS